MSVFGNSCSGFLTSHYRTENLRGNIALPRFLWLVLLFSAPLLTAGCSIALRALDVRRHGDLCVQVERGIMTTIKDFIKRYPLPTYFALTFAISWGAILIAVGPDGIPVTTDQMVVLGMAMLLGPSVAGVLLIGLASGWAGFRELVSRLFRWRVGARWYVVALLTAPLSTAAVLLALPLFSPEFLPGIFTSDDKVTPLLMGIVGGLTVGFFEELGWTGFAIPRMRLRYGVLATGIIVGILWGAWHFLLFWESDSFSAAFPLVLLLVRLFSWLPAYRVLMVWVYDRTESLLVAVLMHTSLLVTMPIEPSLTGGGLVTFLLVRAVVLWIIVAAVYVANSGRLEKQSRSNSLEVSLVYGQERDQRAGGDIGRSREIVAP
jgi:membrane protease YdiL (CAAX protease family)